MTGKVVESDDRQFFLKTDVDVFELVIENKELLSQLPDGDPTMIVSRSVAGAEGQQHLVKAIERSPHPLEQVDELHDLFPPLCHRSGFQGVVNAFPGVHP